MQRRYVTVDVFTDQMFGGNPLAVVLDAQGLSTAQMQAMAREFNYSETSFVMPPHDPAHHARVRIFTPREELPFAGHPSVGTGFALALQGGGTLPDSFLFEEQAGLVPVRLLIEGGRPTGAELTAPAGFERRPGPDAAAVAACLSLPPSDILTDRHGPEIISVGLAFLAVELVSRAALRRMLPNLAAIATVVGSEAAGIYAYSREVGPHEPGTVLQARMVSPMDGILEDPATGSAAAALGGLQAALLSQPDAELSLPIGQGVDMGRPSLLRVQVTRAGGRIGPVRVGGGCVPVMQGSFLLAGSA